MMNSKYTVITGASAGIGFATAIAFASRGKNLVIIARRKHKLEELKAEAIKVCPSIDVIIKEADLSVIDNVFNVYDELRNLDIETWINNAGLGNYQLVPEQNIAKTLLMLDLNVKALTIFSTLFVNQHRDTKGATLINVSSAGGYTIVPTAVTYCATKFYVCSFTEGLYREAKQNNYAVRIKLLAPAATETEFGKTANDVEEYNYDIAFKQYNTSAEMAEYLFELYENDQPIGFISRESFEFTFSEPMMPYAGNSEINQKI